MDKTELHYVTFDPDEIWLEMMAAYLEAGGSILYPGDEKEILLRSVQADFMQVFAALDNAARMHTLRYAVGEYLDVIGESRDCLRFRASEAHAVVRITTNATGEETVLAAGTAMTADGNIFYLLDEDITLSGITQSITANVHADRKGSIGNGLLAGMQMSLAKTNRAVNAIISTTNATGGNDEEKDDVYRERIRTYGITSVTTGTAQQYESNAMAVSSDILDAKAMSIGDAQIRVYLALKDEATSSSVIAAVLARLTEPTIKTLGDQISVQEATDLEYLLKVEYVADNSAETAEAISKAANDYQEWQENERGAIGRPFNPDRLMSAVYQAGATRVFWGAGSHFNDGDVEYTEILSSQRCKGTIQLIQVSQ